MRTQIIEDQNGTPTGVFIPIIEWEKMKKKYNIEDPNEIFQLSDEQKKILDERLKVDKAEFIPARKALNKLRQKYEL